MTTRSVVIFFALFLPFLAPAQGGDQQLRVKADALFQERRFAEATSMYSQLVSLTPGDRELNYRFGTCLLHGGDDKEMAIGHLKFATEDPAGPAAAWYWLGRAYHLNYRFKEAQVAYQRFRGTGDKKALAEWPVEGFEQQCRNGEKLLSSLKDIRVRSKVEVKDSEFFRFYELGDIGGRIVVTPEELMTGLDKKSKHRSLVYLPDRGGPIYFSSLGKDGRTGRDIYRTELLPDGSFATPVKLAGYINTDLDEDYAFMHPDGRTFYFSSKGHNSMGGYDVFRTTYDKGLDAFGRPENLDFAVSTPDDDIFYMVDGEHKEACFASGRSSTQGMLHVYRVSTEQVPVVITILKGTYASEFDKEDRKAHITVVDALTQEQVADVRTDINGSYVLSLPRSGRFRFMVECGPSGKTHGGMVEVPRADGPRAYRQELNLTQSGDLEKLVIRNYFDEPLEGDFIAMALDEIKRRARLDVSTGSDPVAQAPAVEEPVADVLTAAGFTGDVDKAAAVKLAADDAAELEREAMDLDSRSKEALVIAVEALEDADRNTTEAEQLVAEAAKMENEEQRNALMVEAARSRQRARESGMRARAAQRTAEDLANESLATKQQALTAAKLATDVRTTIGAGRDQEALPHLIALKKQHDSRVGPTATPDAAERTRRAVTEQQVLAERAMRQVQAKSTEENELTARIGRLKRDQDATSSRSKKDELQKEINVLEEQLSALRDETRTAKAAALTMERETAVLRGQASLTRHLSTTATTTTSTVPTAVADALPQRIAATESRMMALAIDERYEALLNEPVAAMEARMFNWDLVSAAPGVPTDRAITQTADRGTGTDAQQANVRTAAMQPGEAARAGVNDVNVAQVPVSQDGGTDVEARDTDINATAGSDTEARDVAVDTSTSDANTAQAGTEQQARTGDQRSGGTETARNAAAVGAVVAGGAVRAADGAGAERADANAASTGTRSTGGNEAANTDNGRSADQQNAGAADAQPAQRDADRQAVEPTTAGTEATRSADQQTSAQDTEMGEGDQLAITSAEPLDDMSTERFLLENERAELQQSLPSIRDRAERERVEQRISAVDGELKQLDAAAVAAQEAAEAAAPEDLSDVELDRSQQPLVFTDRTPEELILDSLYADHRRDRERLYKLADADERAAGLNGLELMIADSLRAEMALQLSVLELDPQQASVILPRVERLRQLREAHRAQADRHLSERQEEIAALTAASAQAGAAKTTTTTTASGRDPINDRFVAVDEKQVFASEIEHRATTVDDAVAFKNADLARIEVLDSEIDSLDDRMKGMARDREYQRLEKARDQRLDERYIVRTDLGQRSAYLTKEEWSHGTDSLKQQTKELATKGLAPNEPLVVMAQTMKADAESKFRSGEQLRKQADRSEDIVLRDSLYQRAYRVELEALRELDRAITVNAYLIGEDHLPGQVLSYEEVAASVLGIEEPMLAAKPAASPENVATRSTGTEEGAEDREDVSALVDPRSATTEQTTEGGSTQPAGTDRTSTTTAVVAGAEGAERTAAGQVIGAAAATTTAVAAATGTERTPGTTAAGTAGSNVDSDAVLRQAEARLTERDRLPVGLYEQYLSGEPGSINLTGDSALRDPVLMTKRLVAAQQESDALNTMAAESADRAVALQQSAVGAKKKDRERLELLAVRERSTSDSLRREADLRVAEIRTLEAGRDEALRLQDQRQRVMKFYYLTPEEQNIVFSNTDESRYFQVRARAMQQQEAADEASRAAASNREVARTVQGSAAEARRAAGAGADAATIDQISRLEMRAGELLARADSLDGVAVRLRRAADINENQASVMLQGMDAQRSTEIQAMELRTRRTDALIAEARGQAGSTNAPRGTDGTATAPRTTTNNAAPATERTADATTGTERAGSDGPASERTAGTVVPAITGSERAGTDRSTTERSADNAVPAATGPTAATTIPATTIGGEAARAADNTANTTAPGTRSASAGDPSILPFRMPDELVTDIFELRPVEARVAAPIAMDQPLPEGIVFKVQIGAFRKPVPVEAFSDMTPVMGETVSNDLVRYTAGLFTGFQQAAEAKDKVRGRGYSDAFVVAYRDGKRIPLGEAMRAVNAATEVAGIPGTTGGTARATTGTQPTSTTQPGSTTQPTVSTQPAVARTEGPTVVIPAAAATIDPATTDPAVILASYPATADEVLARFTPVPEATDYYNVPGAAPARQVETIKGLFFTVQVGVYSRPVALDKLFNISPLNSERTETAKVRYTTGVYTDMAPARQRREETIALGVKDAFITAYLNGKRIPMREATALLEKFGPSILARP
jgi:hypothetical protein